MKLLNKILSIIAICFSAIAVIIMIIAVIYVRSSEIIFGLDSDDFSWISGGLVVASLLILLLLRVVEMLQKPRKITKNREKMSEK